MTPIDLVPVGVLALLAIWMYRDGYRLRWTRQTAVVLATAACLAYAGWFLVPSPADAVIQLTWYLGLVYLFAFRSSSALVSRHPRPARGFGQTLFRVDADITKAHVRALEQADAGLLSEADVIDAYEQAVNHLRLLDPPVGSWKPLINERIAQHERAISYLKSPAGGSSFAGELRAESDAWRSRVAEASAVSSDIAGD